MCEHPPFGTHDRFTLITQGMFPTERGHKSFDTLKVKMKEKGLSPDLKGLLSAMDHYVTDQFADFICMFFQPESKRCTWEQILTHPWFDDLNEGRGTSLYKKNNFNNPPLDEQVFEAILKNFPFLLDTQSCLKDNFCALVKKCYFSRKTRCNVGTEAIMNLVAKLYPQKALAYGYQTLVQKYQYLLM
jgi:hypothetical protein